MIERAATTELATKIRTATTSLRRRRVDDLLALAEGLDVAFRRFRESGSEADLRALNGAWARANRLYSEAVGEPLEAA